MTRPTRRNTRTWDRVIRLAHQAGFRAGMASATGRRGKSFEEWYAEFNGTASTKDMADVGAVSNLLDHFGVEHEVLEIGDTTYVKTEQIIPQNLSEEVARIRTNTTRSSQ